MNTKNQDGFTLIEVLIALAIFADEQWPCLPHRRRRLAALVSGTPLRSEGMRIPADFDYALVNQLRGEAREKFEELLEFAPDRSYSISPGARSYLHLSVLAALAVVAGAGLAR